MDSMQSNCVADVQGPMIACGWPGVGSTGTHARTGAADSAPIPIIATTTIRARARREDECVDAVFMPSQRSGDGRVT
jgi:hypothetical protein